MAAPTAAPRTLPVATPPTTAPVAAPIPAPFSVDAQAVRHSPTHPMTRNLFNSTSVKVCSRQRLPRPDHVWALTGSPCGNHLTSIGAQCSENNEKRAETCRTFPRGREPVHALDAGLAATNEPPHTTLFPFSGPAAICPAYGIRTGGIAQNEDHHLPGGREV